MHRCLGKSAAPFNSSNSPTSPHLHVQSQLRSYLQCTSADLQTLLGSKSRTTKLDGTPWLRGHVSVSTSCEKDIVSSTSKIASGERQGVSYWCGSPRTFSSHKSTGNSNLIGLVFLLIVISRSITGWASREFRHRCCLTVAQHTISLVE